MKSPTGQPTTSRYALKKKGVAPPSQERKKLRRTCNQCGGPLARKKGHGFVDQYGKRIFCGGCVFSP